MSTPEPTPSSPPRLAGLPREPLLRAINTIAPLLLISLMLFAAIPRDRFGEAMQARHDRVIEALRKFSISQSWSMYAPNPSRGHFYLELRAVDADGTVRVLEESDRIDWTTAWVWTKDRQDIWLHAVSRRVDEVNRNRTWYMRGVCVREARRGYDVRRIEANRVDRSIRAPDKVLAGTPLLGPERRQKTQDTSCRVEIIRDMIAYDQAREVDGD
ncbi:hypothetical protein ACNOYE_34995 [Nannocystaceae bacterium ST9]